MEAFSTVVVVAAGIITVVTFFDLIDKKFIQDKLTQRDKEFLKTQEELLRLVESFQVSVDRVSSLTLTISRVVITMTEELISKGNVDEETKRQVEALKDEIF